MSRVQFQTTILSLCICAIAVPSGTLAQTASALVESICEGCTIRLDTIASIDRSGDPSLSDQAIVAVSPLHELFVLDPVLHPGLLLHFDNRGKLIQSHNIGYIAEPGYPLFDPVGRVWIPEERDGKLHRVLPESDNTTPSLAVDYPQGAVFLSDDHLVINAHSARANRSRYALHSLVLGSATVNSFDRIDTRIVNRARILNRLTRRLWPRPDNAVWSAHLLQYQVDLWKNQQLVRSLTRSVPWFTPSEERANPAVVYPTTNIRGVFEDDTGLLWVVILAGDLAWKPYELPFDPDGMGGLYVGRNRHLRNQVYDTIIEVIDVDENTVVAHRRIDGELGPPTGVAGVVVEYSGPSNDAGIYYIVRLTLERPSVP